jgi:hypothetical protein
MCKTIFGMYGCACYANSTMLNDILIMDRWCMHNVCSYHLVPVQKWARRCIMKFDSLVDSNVHWRDSGEQDPQDLSWIYFFLYLSSLQCDNPPVDKLLNAIQQAWMITR